MAVLTRLLARAMKLSFPLSLKISLWLLLNLLLLGGAGGAIYVSQFGFGWQSLRTGALGERLQRIGDGVVSEFYAAPADEREAVLERRRAGTGADFFLFRNDGQQVAGRPAELPPSLRAELGKGRRPGPPGDQPPEGVPGMPGPGEPPRRGPLFAASAPGVGRMVFHETNPAATWIGLRVPLPREHGLPEPGTLVIRAPDVLALVRLFEAGGWFALAAGALVLSLLFWLPLVVGMTRMLNRLTHATEQIAEGRFDIRVPADRRDEIGRLGQSVNRMAARLDTLVNGQKRFLADVAHELGSPLGRLQVAVEILESRTDPSLQAQVGDVREEVQQMSDLVNELLIFTRAGLRPHEPELVPVALDEIVRVTLDRENAGSRVRVALDPGLLVRADPTLLGRALGNLIRNALRFAGDAGPITLKARREDAVVLISIEDEGPGVPPAALARLGEPFYRPEMARTRETGGAGLGLAIVRSCVAACGGQVQFANRTPHGFRAEVRLAAG